MPTAGHSPGSEAEDIAAFLAEANVRLGSRILDVPCGIGRRAFTLAEHGYRVTAVDPNEVAIQALKDRVPAALAPRLEYRHASRETLPGPPLSESFHVILCLDHVLGRGPADEEVAFLERLRGHLASGGFLVLDLLHRDFFASRPRPFSYHVIGDLEQHEFRSFDPVTGVLELTWKFYQREGKDLRFRGSNSARMRLLAPHEAERLLQESGWRLESARGGWGEEPVSPDRRKLVLLARPSARG